MQRSSSYFLISTGTTLVKFLLSRMHLKPFFSMHFVGANIICSFCHQGFFPQEGKISTQLFSLKKAASEEKGAFDVRTSCGCKKWGLNEGLFSSLSQVLSFFPSLSPSFPVFPSSLSCWIETLVHPMNEGHLSSDALRWFAWKEKNTLHQMMMVSIRRLLT